MSAIAENLCRVEERIAWAALRAGRRPEEVVLVAATKDRTAREVEEAVRAGVKIVGENRVQEAEAKFPQIGLPFRKHMIGHLQRNKVRKALMLFDAIQSVDSLRLGEEISKRAIQMDRTIEVLVEVNTSGEATKFGVDPEGALDLLGALSELEGISVKGLMTVGPLSEDVGEVRRAFSLLRSLRDEIERELGLSLPVLSMGMSGDFEKAIEEGSTMVRIGTAIFGPRSSGYTSG
ncbi:MAG TPA: YggS family pyridoxal phosphate-dependent enzyme [Candidatus Latescibacteria bacterium]|nr:YggS family pyridoxal phosphate-dependent enzyme [Candidatus Latescibacterota bacterium]